MTYIFLITEHVKSDWIPEVVLNEGGRLKILHATEKNVEAQLKAFMPEIF